MLESEKLAIAAHLHVAMRRKIGRVIDVEWVVRNTDYAREVIRVARQDPAHTEVLELAAKLQAALFPAPPPPQPKAVPKEIVTPVLRPVESRRYVGSLR